MKEVTLAQLLRRNRGARSLREMARLTGITVTSIKLLEDGETLQPQRDTLNALAAAYRIPPDDLALAAYGLLFEEVPQSANGTSPEQPAPADNVSGVECSDPMETESGRNSRRVIVST